MSAIRSFHGTRSKGSIITARKRAEYALRSSEAKLSGILAIAGDAIVSIDAGYRINLFNEAAERLFGYSPPEVLGQPIDILIPTRFHSTHRQHIERFASGPDMADAHVLLSHSRWKGVGLADLVRHQLAPYANAGNTTIDGPEVMLSAATTEAVAMVLYELVTNAAKYGALSTPQGRVFVTWAGVSKWRLSEGIVIEWREKGGPLVAAAKQSGYGTNLICELIPHEIGGVVYLAFSAEGVSCKIRLPPAQQTDGDR